VRVVGDITPALVQREVRLLHEAEHVDVEAQCVVELRHGEGRGHGCRGGRA
jgi:hypothetical protein